MTTEYRVIDFQFDAEKWAVHITAMIKQVGEKELAAMLGMTISGLRHWANNRYPMGFSYPSMTNFLLACNLMDADPRQFFILGE
jgi:hypothetical protein